LAIARLLQKTVRQEAALMGVTPEPLPCLPVLPATPGNSMDCELGFSCPLGK